MKSKKLIDGFRYAFSGVKSSIKSERNMKIHIFIAMMVVIFGLLLKIKIWEWIVCISLIALVIGAEMFNTAIEIAVDLAMPKINDNAKKSKDISAGAVLIFAIGSAIIGMIIFLPKLLGLLIK